MKNKGSVLDLGVATYGDIVVNVSPFTDYTVITDTDTFSHLHLMPYLGAISNMSLWRDLCSRMYPNLAYLYLYLITSLATSISGDIAERLFIRRRASSDKRMALALTATSRRCMVSSSLSLAVLRTYPTGL